MRETLRPGRGATAFAGILSTLAFAATLILAGCGATSTGSALGAESPTATTAPTATSATTPTPSGPQEQITITGGGIGYNVTAFGFDPKQVTVKAGTTVVWSNNSGTTHNITSDAGDPATFTLPVDDGNTVSFKFTKPGTYPYHCSIHPTMKGTIVVTS
jgi:plastocyanin